ncbi:MAG: CheR family methyltransferase [Nitrospira sp.]
MSITVTSMFRDPLFYKALREKIVPVLKTFPFIKIWHAGCATGEEVYSMALLLHEEGFLERTRIYATDFNKHSLHAAEKGVYPVRNVEAYAANYTEAGGTTYLSNYYSDRYELVEIQGVSERAHYIFLSQSGHRRRIRRNELDLLPQCSHLFRQGAARPGAHKICRQPAPRRFFVSGKQRILEFYRCQVAVYPRG